MRILSWNILNGGQDGRDRLERVLAACKATSSDILILQEACQLASDDNLLRWAEEFLDMSAFPVEARSGYHLCAFANRSISVEPSALFEGFYHAAIVLSLPVDKQPMTIVGVHLCPDVPTTRRQEVLNLLTHIPRVGFVMIIGDFNSPDPVSLEAIPDHLPATLTRRYIDGRGLSDGLFDAFQERGFVDLGMRFDEDGPTFATGGPHVGLYHPMRLDYAQADASLANRVSGFTVLRGMHIEALSDHLPIQVSLREE